MKYRPTLSLMGLLALTLPAAALAEESKAAAKEPTQAILILDASGSMWGKVKGRAKIEIAREVVRDFVEKADPSLHLGLMTYGHRSKGDCDDIELLIPPGPIDRAAFLKAVNAINPKGKTPLTEAVTKAADALRSSEEKATVILVSDGLETCDKDPCAAAKKLEEEGLDFTAHVVGFDLSEKDQNTIRCLADTTGGVFVPASDADSLREALNTVAQETVKKEESETGHFVKVRARTLMGKGGKAVPSHWTFALDGGLEVFEDEGESFELAPGEYDITAKHGENEVTAKVTVPEGKNFEIELIYEATTLEIKVSYDKEGEDEVKDPIYTVFQQDENGQRGKKVSEGFHAKQTLPPGKYIVHARIASGEAEVPVELKPGETTLAEINLGMGHVDFIITGGGQEVKDLRIDYYPDLGEGKRGKYLRSGLTPKMSLKQGDYIAVIKWTATLHETVPFSIEPGKTLRPEVNIEAGWVDLTLVGGTGSGIMKVISLDEEKRPTGSRLTPKEKGSYALRPGKYRFEGWVDKEKATVEVEVRHGERTAAKLEKPAKASSED